MSADLLEAFGGEDETQTVQPSPLQSKLVNDKSNETQSRHTGLIYSRRFDPQPAPLRDEPLWTASEGGNDVLFDAAHEEDPEPVDDDFGDFEDVQQPSDHARTTETERPRAVPPPTVKAGQSDATLIDLLSLEDNTQPHRQTQPVQHGSSGLLATDLWETQTPSSSSKAAPPPSPPTQDDDWGDFEDVGSSQPEDPTTIRQKSGEIFTSLQPAETPQTAPPASADPTFEDDWAAFEDGAPEPVAPPPKPSAPAKQPPPPAEEDDWDAFEDGMPATSTPPTTQPQPQPPPAPAETPSAFPPSATRPTNIPPPSTLLSLLPSIYSTLTNPTAPALLHLYQTTARIAAARPQRWRRDTLLSQSTRIAPAAAGGKSSGMKLSSLNKGEAAREEREASEALAAWNAGVLPRWHGVLRESGGAGAGGPKGWRLQLPLGVQSVAAREGGLEASYVCPVCGMKRSERVVGVDDGVEDVFGEFWVEGWGHRACGEVWYAWKGMLGQR